MVSLFRRAGTFVDTRAAFSANPLEFTQRPNNLRGGVRVDELHGVGAVLLPLLDADAGVSAPLARRRHRRAQVPLQHNAARRQHCVQASQLFLNTSSSGEQISVGIWRPLDAPIVASAATDLNLT